MKKYKITVFLKIIEEMRERTRKPGLWRASRQTETHRKRCVGLRDWSLEDPRVGRGEGEKENEGVGSKNRQRDKQRSNNEDF